VAELALKVDPGGDDDGDCLCAFNDRQIGCTYMQHICHHRKAPRKSGLILPGSLTQIMLERVSEFRFERTGKNTAQRVILATMDVEPLSGMAVSQFITRARRSKNRVIFGEYGREIWYGGNTDYSVAAVDDVWAGIEVYVPPEPPPFVPVDEFDEPPAIEEYVPKRRVNYPLWPAGRQDLKQYLFITVDDFDDTEAKELVVPLTRNTGTAEKPVIEIVEERKHKVAWRDLPGVIEDFVLDPWRTVDIREDRSYVRRDIVLEKTVSLEVNHG